MARKNILKYMKYIEKITLRRRWHGFCIRKGIAVGNRGDIRDAITIEDSK